MGFRRILIVNMCHLLKSVGDSGAPDCHAQHAVLDLRFYDAGLEFHFERLFVEDGVWLVMAVDEVEIGDFIHDFGRR